ncbi:hypothetical protein G7I34_000606 [Salmonella enterica subsp. enterica serovar 4,[5],12:i:-]|uniref:Coiled-coil protein n=1 Tax=Salmonella enterica subsp. enterica serovar 4,[5],12:i:- TaxID=440524 RepID=A0A730FIR1_SALET|nr:hypothetical protein [Salmonella enterica subsp. enterica serovar 4,[5],12:i:-]EKR2465933.1 hypothetical protein [Salmonella enterica subsp. enterica serovar 4,[5],12:i:-]HAE3796744.1 hypothetical protein [Salmonella enterica subsp. enterica serovar 4,[5],12:i:-]
MMSSITKSIQNEYVLLMENAFSEKYKYAFRNLELKELRRFILKELISSPELDNQLTNLIVLLNKFWDTHAAALITEVRASKSYRLLLPIQRFGYNISNHLRSLGIYFDSIIMVDPLHFPSLSSLHSFLSLPPDNSYVRMRRLVLLEHVSNLEWTTEQLVKDYGKLNPLSSEEQAITMGLSAAEVKFLTALSDLELKKIRERGQLESLRHELRISRHDLQGKTPDQMQDAANNFSKHLINVVEEYGKSHESAIKNSKKKKISSGLIFAGTATLGIASLAMPQLTLLSAAATGIGLAFGGKSLADIFSEHKAHKNEIQILEKTPVSLLYGAYKKK